MSTTSLTLGDLTDEALDHVYRAVERPRPVTVGSNSLTSSSGDTTLTLASGSDDVHETAILEFGSELVLVTAKSEDATPVFTVSRGYLGTTVAEHVAAEVGLLNPSWPRYTVARAIRQGLAPLATWLPRMDSAVYNRSETEAWVALPANTIDVTKVSLTQRPGWVDSNFYDWQEVPGWQFEAHVPAAVESTGKLVRVPHWLSDADDLIVVRQVPYEWLDSEGVVTSSPDESATVAVPATATDIPALYAACRLLAGREMSRVEIETISEAHYEGSFRSGANVRLIQAMWQDFYRRVDEARRNLRIPKTRPYRPMPRR